MMSMRKKTAATIRSILWILVGMPALNLVVRFIYTACGLNLPTILSIPDFIVFMVAMAAFLPTSLRIT